MRRHDIFAPLLSDKAIEDIVKVERNLVVRNLVVRDLVVRRDWYFGSDTFRNSCRRNFRKTGSSVCLPFPDTHSDKRKEEEPFNLNKKAAMIAHRGFDRFHQATG
jgi:hypothetical protein